MLTEQLLCWSDMTDTEHSTTSSSNGKEEATEHSTTSSLNKEVSSIIIYFS